MHDLATQAPPTAATSADALRATLIDSRQRWRELVDLAADFAFETDEWGRFALIAPDPALGWDAGTLIAQQSAALLADADATGFNPFRVSARVRHRPVWLKRSGGGTACLSFCAAPILDAAGRIIGARGVGIDMTGLDAEMARTAAALRHAEVLDLILRHMGQEVLAERRMEVALNGLSNALGSEGAAVLLVSTDLAPARLAHAAGACADSVVEAANTQLGLRDAHPTDTVAADRRPVLVAACDTRFGEKAGLVAWRPPEGRAWDREDRHLIGAAANLVRMILEREATQHDMARQARTDPLTGLLNRRAFLEELGRHAARQDRDNVPGTLMFADLDHFKPVNDRLGHETGDEVLRCTAALLRQTFRPTDLIARLGGDEFAIWLNGADHMTAAERAEFLRDAVPRELADITGPDLPRVTLSIGIASRDPADGESIGSLMRRADMAMYEVKRGGRGHWRVSLRKRPT